MADHVTLTPLENLDAIAFRRDATTVTYIAPRVPKWCRRAVVEHLAMAVRVADGPCASAWLSVGEAVQLATEPALPRRMRLPRIPVPSRPLIAAALAAIVAAPVGGLVTAAFQGAFTEPSQVVDSNEPAARDETVAPPAPRLTPLPPVTVAPPPPAPAVAAPPLPPASAAKPPAAPTVALRFVEVAPSRGAVHPQQVPVVLDVVHVVDTVPVVGDVVDVPDEVVLPLRVGGLG